MLNLHSDVIISFAMVENGGIEPKIMILSLTYDKLWPIFDFYVVARQPNCKKHKNYLQEGNWNIIGAYIPSKSYPMNMIKVLNRPKYVQYSPKCAKIDIFLQI